jgi:hypothetical protein
MKEPLLVLSAAALCSVGLSAQQRTPAVVVTEIEALVVTELEAMLPVEQKPDAVPVVQVPVDGDLQSVLNAVTAPTIVRLSPGATYTGGFVAPSNVTIWGEGAHLVGVGKAALRVRPGTTDVIVKDLIGTSNYSSVFQVGANDNADPMLSPKRITLQNVRVPTHRGQRGIELHGEHITVLDPEVLDTWSSAGAESQGIWINNGAGPYTIRGGHIEAGSINILVGGANTGIPGLIPADITVEDLSLEKPLVWMKDGVLRGGKNLFELKTGERVRVRNVRMSGSYVDAQVGYAIMLTPRSKGGVRDVSFENITISNVAGCIRITGHNDHHLVDAAAPFTTTGIVFRNTTCVADKTLKVPGRGDGTGRLLELLHAVGTVRLDHVVFTGNGTSIINVGSGEVGESLTLTNSVGTVGQYGIFLQSKAGMSTMTVTGNTFSGLTAAAPTAFRTAYPANTFVRRPELDVLVAARLQE